MTCFRYALRVSAGLALCGWLAACATESPAPSLRKLTELAGDETWPTVSPAGDRVAFVSDQGAGRRVQLLDLETGAVRQLAEGLEDSHDAAWAPDGSRLAFTARGETGRDIWAIRVDEPEAAQRLNPPGTDTFRPRWSPTGELLVFTRQDQDGRQVWLLSFDGSQPRQLTDGPESHIAYGWSPDGSEVLAISFGADAQNVWAWPVNGDPPRALTERADEEWWPTWSPAGDRIAFYTTWDDAMTDVWTAEVDGGRLEQISESPSEDFLPAWSPDGTALAYISDRLSKSGLWVQRIGGEAHSIALGGRAGGLPAWTPDGSAIVFSFLTGHDRLFRVDRSGGDPIAISEESQTVVEASVSQDGTTVAFESHDVASEADLFTLDLGTGEVIRLTDEIDYNARPSWSPDGAQLAFERGPGGGPRTTNLAVMNLATREIRLLTDTGYVRSPLWCGERFVYSMEHSIANAGPDQLWTIPLTGGEPQRLTDSPGDKRATDCTSDGRVAYHHRVDGDTYVRVAQLDASGSLSEPVDFGLGDGPRWSADGRELAFRSAREGQMDLYIASTVDGTIGRVTDSALVESWPDWAGDDLVFSADPAGSDLWLAEIDLESLR